MAALALCVWVVSSAGAQVLEGFENLPAVKTDKGSLTAVRGAEGVTEGAQAAQLPAGGGIVLTLAPGACRKAAWLRIDTLTTQPLVCPMLLRFSGPKVSTDQYAYVQSGKDVLALPLPSLVNTDPSPWDDKIVLTIRNAGPAALILDNVRFEEAVKLPQDCEAIDFGWMHQPLWPGFAAGEVNDRHVTWSGQNQISPLRLLPIDPLWTDGVGPAWWTKTTPETMELTGIGSGASVAWLWVGHVRQYMQSTESWLKLGGKTLLSKRLTRAQMFSPEGLFQGQDGQWTPQWFETAYAGMFYDVVQVSLSPGKNKLELFNCQIAAMVTGPASAQTALAAHVEKVKKDLAQYHRQFVLGQRIEATCDVEPDEAQAKAGLLVFIPPPDKAALSSYKPGVADCPRALKGVAANGSLAVLPLAMSPIKRAGQISGTLTPLKSADGKILCPATDAQVVFLEAVPRLTRAAVEFQPWLVVPRHGPAQPKQVVHAAVTVRIPQTTVAGTYKGSIHLTASEAQADLPVEIEVLQIGPPMPAAVFGVTGGTGASDFYRSWIEAFNDVQQEAVQTKVRQQLLSLGLNSLPVIPPSLSNDKLYEAAFAKEMKNVAPLGAHHLMVDFGGPLSQLHHGNLKPGTGPYQAAVRDLSKSVADQTARVHSEATLFAGFAETAQDLLEQCREAQDFDSKVARIAASAYASTVTSLSADDKDRLKSLQSLALEPNVKGFADLVAEFKKPGGKQVFVHLWGADRYAAGFYAAACGADGVFLAHADMEYPTYSGFQTSMMGLLSPAADGSFTPLLGSIVLQRGMDDFDLFRRAADLARRAEALNVDVKELAKTLAAIRGAANGGYAVDYDPALLRTASVPPSQMDAWRDSLLRESAEVFQRLQPKK